MNVPQLRFDGFDKAWVKIKLKDVAIVTSSKRVYLNDYVSKGIPFYRGKEITELKSGKVPKDLLYISEEKFNEFKNRFGAPVRNDILITAVGTIGNSMLVEDEKEFYFKDGNLIWLREINESPRFLLYVFSNPLGFKRLIDSASGSNQKALTIAGLNEMEFKIPEIVEQKKIAAFLNLIDQKIKKQTEKVEKLKQFKKGMMQKIFSQELRFKDKDGGEFPEWKNYNLKDLVDFCRNGLSLTQSSQKNGIKVTRIETISEGKINLSKVGYVSTEKNISDYKLKVSDILFSNINSVAHIGKVAIVDEDYNLYHGMNLLCIRTNESNDGTFLFYSLRQERYKSYFQMICNQAVNQASINQTELLKTELSRPVLKEQKKISSFFLKLDSKIEKEKEKLMILEEQKKGFMQGMFV